MEIEPNFKAQTHVRGSGDGKRRPQGANRKKALMPTERLEAVGWLVGERSMPISRACRALNLGRSCYYRPQRNQAEHDAPVIASASFLK